MFYKTPSKEVISTKSFLLPALLAVVILYLFILPIVESYIPLSIEFLFVFAILILIGLVLSENRKWFLLVVSGILIILIVSEVAPLNIFATISRILSNLFFLYVVFALISVILKQENVTVSTLMEAIVGYLILGIALTGYTKILSDINPGAFSEPLRTLTEAKYFTFVTMTTLGYGDIVPLSDVAKSLTLFITITGQFYVAIIVALLVGKYSGQAR